MLYHHHCPSYHGEQWDHKVHMLFSSLAKKKKKQHERGTIEDRSTLRICHSVGVF